MLMVKLQSQHFFATGLLHAIVAIHWLCMEVNIVFLFGAYTHKGHFLGFDIII